MLAADNPVIFINGQQFKTNNLPFIKNGTTLVPLRDIVEEYNLDIEWNQQYNGIRINTPKKILLMKPNMKTIMQFIIDKNYYDDMMADFKGEINSLPQPLLVKEGVTYIPVRFLSETLNFHVVYNNTENKIVINGNKIKSNERHKVLNDFYYNDISISTWNYNEFVKKAYHESINQEFSFFDKYEKYITENIWITNTTEKYLKDYVTEELKEIKNLTKVKIIKIIPDNILGTKVLLNIEGKKYWLESYNDFYPVVLDLNFISDNPFNKYNWSQKVWDAIKANKVFIGMTKNMVELSWGFPEEINESIGSWGIHEQWVYPSYQYLYFENGKLTSIQN